MNPSSESGKKPQSLRARVKEAGRATILDAAEELIAEQGLRSVRMEDIATRVGVSVGTLYNYFKDRQQLLTALFDLRGGELLALLQEELKRGQGLGYRERLGAFLRCILEYIRGHFRLFSVRFEDGMRHGPSHERDVDRHHELWTEVRRCIDHLNEEGVRQGVLRPEDTRHYAVLLLSLVRGVLVEQFRTQEPSPTDEAIALLLRTFLDGASPRPPSSPQTPTRGAAR